MHRKLSRSSENLLHDTVFWRHADGCMVSMDGFDDIEQGKQYKCTVGMLEQTTVTHFGKAPNAFDP